MSPRSFLLLLTTAGVLASASADAAGLSPNLSIRSSSTNNTMTFAGHVGHYPGGYPGPHYPAPFPRSTSNDQFDTNGNINPGGGGGSIKPGKTPNKK